MAQWLGNCWAVFLKKFGLARIKSDLYIKIKSAFFHARHDLQNRTSGDINYKWLIY
jgi:hypothetical protein